MIKEVKLVKDLMDQDFENKLMQIVKRYRNMGLTVEIQYGGENHNGYYTALVIGREKE